MTLLFIRLIMIVSCVHKTSLDSARIPRKVASTRTLQPHALVESIDTKGPRLEPGYSWAVVFFSGHLCPPARAQSSALSSRITRRSSELFRNYTFCGFQRRGGWHVEPQAVNRVNRA